MRSWLVFVVMFLASTGKGAAAAGPPEHGTRRLVVLDLSTDTTIPTDAARLVQDTLTVSFAKKAGFEVVSSEDLRRIVSLDAEKQALGCDESSCLAELASAMGADLVVYGSIGALGTLTVVNINLFDSNQNRSLGRETVEAATREEIPRQLRLAVDTLSAAALGQVYAPAVVIEPRGPSPLLIGGIVGVGIGGAATVIGGLLAIDANDTVNDKTASASARDTARGQGPVWLGVAGAGVVVVGAGVVAVVLGLVE